MSLGAVVVVAEVVAVVTVPAATVVMVTPGMDEVGAPVDMVDAEVGTVWATGLCKEDEDDSVLGSTSTASLHEESSELPAPVSPAPVSVAVILDFTVRPHVALPLSVFGAIG